MNRMSLLVSVMSELSQNKTDCDVSVRCEQCAQAPGTGSWYLDTLAARPDLCYHTAHSLALGLLAASTLRMKCFWAPYICVLGATALADTTLWAALLSKVGTPLSSLSVTWCLDIRSLQQSHGQPREAHRRGLSHHRPLQQTEANV